MFEKKPVSGSYIHPKKEKYFKVEIRAHARHDFDKKGVLILD